MYQQMTSLLLTLLCITSMAAQASVYKWVDDNGKTHYGDRSANQSAQQISIEKINTTHAPAKHTTKSVTIYTTSWCSSCKTAKRYFKQHHIPYTEYDVEKSRKGKRDFKRLNGRGVPIILVGKQRLDGFRASSFKRLYE